MLQAKQQHVAAVVPKKDLPPDTEKLQPGTFELSGIGQVKQFVFLS